MPKATLDPIPDLGTNAGSESSNVLDRLGRKDDLIPSLGRERNPGASVRSTTSGDEPTTPRPLGRYRRVVGVGEGRSAPSPSSTGRPLLVRAGARATDEHRQWCARSRSAGVRHETPVGRGLGASGVVGARAGRPLSLRWGNQAFNCFRWWRVGSIAPKAVTVSSTISSSVGGSCSVDPRCSLRAARRSAWAP